MHKCEHFAIQELVPRAVYEARGEKAWEVLDDRALRVLDLLRKRYGPITVNNWHTGGDREWSGLRTPESPWFSPYSQHTFGRAFDCIFSNTTAEQVRKDILADPDSELARLITSMELGTSWLHFDVRNTKRIKTFYP